MIALMKDPIVCDALVDTGNGKQPPINVPGRPSPDTEYIVCENKKASRWRNINKALLESLCHGVHAQEGCKRVVAFVVKKS